MFKKFGIIFCVFIMVYLLSFCPAFSENNNYDSLIQKFISSSRFSWDTIINENRQDMTSDFFARTFELAQQQIGKNNENAILHAELIDYIDYFLYDKKDYRGVALSLLGSKFLNIPDYENASKCAQVMFGMDPQCLKAYILRGKTEAGLNNLKSAEEDFNKAITIDPKSEDAHFYLAKLYLIKNDAKNAQKEFEEVLKINPNNAGAKDAVAMLSGKVVSKTSTNKEAMKHFNKAEEFFGAGKYKEAAVEYKLAIKEDPKYVKAYIYLGDAYYGLGDMQTAITFYKKALTLDPSDRQAHRFLGNAMEKIYDKTGNVKYLDEAIASYENAVKADPEYNLAKQDLDLAKEKKNAIK